MSHIEYLSVCLSKSGYLIKPGATNPAKLSGHLAPGTCLFPSLDAGIKVHMPCLPFYVVAKDLDSGPHALHQSQVKEREPENTKSHLPCVGAKFR